MSGSVSKWGGTSVLGSVYTSSSETQHFDQSLNTTDAPSFAGITLSGVPLNVAHGGTGASSASEARSNLGLGSMATQAASAVAVTGGTVSGVAVSGGTISGAAVTGGTIASAAMSGGTIEDAALSGGTIDGATITGLNDPVAAGDAVSKHYADSLVSGLTLKAPVRCATTAAGTLATDFAVGQAVDGVTLLPGDRVLVKNQADATENGLYAVTEGAPTRTTDADNSPSSGEVAGGLFVFVQEGTANGDTGWVLTSPTGAATLGADALVFSQFSAFIYTAGTGLQLSSRQFSVQYGSSGSTACVGNDSRLSDARQCNNTFADAATSRTALGLGSASTPTFSGLSLAKSGTGVTGELSLSAGLDGDASTSNRAILRLQTQAGGGGVVETVLAQEYTGSDYALTISNETLTNVAIDNSSGAVYLRGVPSGYVTSSSGDLSASASVPHTDVSGLGNLATQSAPSAGLVTSNGSTLSSQAVPSAGLVTSNGSALSSQAIPSAGLVTSNGSALSSQAIPSAGYVTSNGTSLSSTASVPSADVSFSSGLTVTGGAINLNASSNHAVNVGTGTNSATTTVGNTANDFTAIAGTEVGIETAAGETVHIADSYWSGDGSARHVSIGNAHASSTVTVKPPLLLGNSNYAVGAPVAGIRFVYGVVNMNTQAFVGSQHAGCTLDSSDAGKIKVAFTTEFTYPPVVTTHVSYKYTDGTFYNSVASRSLPSDITTAYAVLQTFNTGDAALQAYAPREGSADPIYLHFIIMGV